MPNVSSSSEALYLSDVLVITAYARCVAGRPDPKVKGDFDCEHNQCFRSQGYVVVGENLCGEHVSDTNQGQRIGFFWAQKNMFTK